MKVFVSGGGTGGHFFPALALIECFLERQINTVFVGSERGIEKRLRDRIPVESYFFKSYPFMGMSLKDKLFSTYKNLMEALRVAKLITRKDRAITFGGYASLPLGIACLLKGTPLYLHEQNSIPSRTNRLFMRFAKKVFITFEFSKKFFPEEKVVKTGLPVRRSLLEGLKLSREEALRKLGLENKNTLLVIGGSQGASFLNRLALEIFPKMDWQGVHITGDRDYESIRDFYKAKGLRVLVLPFSHEMELIYKASTVALSRAGASTITELSLYGIPAIFVPFPHAVADHQFYNAKEIEDLGGGLVLRQEAANVEKVIQGIERLMADYKAFSQNIRLFANPLACEEMQKYILKEEGV